MMYCTWDHITAIKFSTFHQLFQTKHTISYDFVSLLQIHIWWYFSISGDLRLIHRPFSHLLLQRTWISFFLLICWCLGRVEERFSSLFYNVGWKGNCRQLNPPIRILWPVIISYVKSTDMTFITNYHLLHCYL